MFRLCQQCQRYRENDFLNEGAWTHDYLKFISIYFTCARGRICVWIHFVAFEDILCTWKAKMYVHVIVINFDDFNLYDLSPYAIAILFIETVMRTKTFFHWIQIICVGKVNFLLYRVYNNFYKIVRISSFSVRSVSEKWNCKRSFFCCWLTRSEKSLNRKSNFYLRCHFRSEKI